MSSTPLVSWSFELPSAAATRPSTTIGLCQCASPIGSRADLLARRRRVDGDRAAPLDVEQAAREHRARAAVAVRPDLVQPPAREPPGGRAVEVARNTHVPFQVAGSEKRSVGPGTGTVCSSPPVVALTPASAREPEQAQLAVLAALDEVAVRRAVPARSSRGRDRRAFSSAWFAGVQCFSSRFASGERTSTLSPQFVLPSKGALPVATSRSPVAGSTTGAERPQIAESLAGHVEGWMIPCRSEQSEFQTPTILPFAGFERHDVPLVGRRVADVAVGRGEHEAVREVERRGELLVRRVARDRGRPEHLAVRDRELPDPPVGRAGVDRGAARVGDRRHRRDLRGCPRRPSSPAA